MTPNRLGKVVRGFELMLDRGEEEPQLLKQGGALLRELVSHDDWLPERYAQPHSQYYQQYLLHCDPAQRFCIVSFVWGAGQSTPIHDHGVWALVGMMRGAEKGERFSVSAEGEPMMRLDEVLLEPGHVEALSPSAGDIHRVSNAYADRVSISIHIYGGNIGNIKRHVFDAATSHRKEFVSGYANADEPV